MTQVLPNILPAGSPRSLAYEGVTRLLLASKSPARLKTLRAAGIEPIVQGSDVDEDSVLAAAVHLNGPLDPSETALLLARAKAEAVTSKAPADAMMLGCDSVLELDGDTHGKPADAAEATARWRLMRGRTGVLHTGHWLIDGRDAAYGGPQDGTGGTVGATASTAVRFADVTDDEIDAYVATGEPIHVAGAFTVDGFSGPFISGIDGDFHNVVGLSLPLLRRLLADLGVAIVDLWRPHVLGDR